ncbi:Pro-Pol polyprotein [Dictyocoela muelleri]|nr:Pro-Pol polyprotein [Dictyocoela muelleri]
MEHVKGRPRYPESQGQIERFNGTLKRRLSKCLFGKEKMWISVLRNVLFQYNSSIHKATSKSPFEIFRGIKIRTNSLFHCNKISSDIIKNTENYVSRIYKNTDLSSKFKINDRVLLAKDFDKNINTRKDPLICNFYEIIYNICEIRNNLILIKSDSGESLWVDPKRIKKIND